MESLFVMLANSSVRKVLGLVAGVSLYAVSASQTILVTDQGSNRVLQFNESNGALRRVIASGSPLSQPMGVAYGPGGMVYVSSNGSHQILRYSENGGFIDVFATTPNPRGMSFVSRDLVVANGPSGTITRFGETNWTSPPRERDYRHVVHRRGRLFASFHSAFGGGIEEFDPQSGFSFGDLIAPTAELDQPEGFNWSYDGSLVIANSGKGNVMVCNGQTGLPTRTINAQSGAPVGVLFNGSGDLLVTATNNRTIGRYSMWRGQFASTWIGAPAGLMQPWAMQRINPRIEFRAEFEGWVGTGLPDTHATIEFRSPGSRSSLVSFRTPIQADRRFYASAPAFLGEYDVWIKVGRFLSKLERIDTSDASASFPVVRFTPGDADGNDVVDVLDYRIFHSAFGASLGQPNFDARVDFNGDGIVNESDGMIFGNTFSRRGAL